MTVMEKCRRLVAVLQEFEDGKQLEVLVDGVWEELTANRLPDPTRYRVRPDQAGRCKACSHQ